jgi:predicted AAA+ superfamily ATPase
MYRHIKARLRDGGMNYVFLDEAQNIASFERLVDGLFIKKNVDIYVTGSNGYLLSGELATLLTGRYLEISILPFSFAEYCEATNSPNSSKNESLANFLGRSALPYLACLPESDLSLQASRFIAGVLAAVIEKDIFKRHIIHNKAAFHKVLDFTLDSIGSMVSPRSIADTLRTNGMIVDKQTVGTYLGYLSEAFLFYKVPRYDVKGKQLLQTLDKYYVADQGLRRFRPGGKAGDGRGHLLENVVYLELRRRNREVYIGKLHDKEVDFVTVDNKGYMSYYQVAYSVTDAATLERELAPLRAIRDSNPKYLLSADWDTNPVYDGIRKLNVIDWLIEGK